MPRIALIVKSVVIGVTRGQESSRGETAALLQKGASTGKTVLQKSPF
jgi:hypothetical protein